MHPHDATIGLPIGLMLPQIPGNEVNNQLA